jgi:hypothetical protein
MSDKFVAFSHFCIGIKPTISLKIDKAQYTSDNEPDKAN